MTSYATPAFAGRALPSPWCRRQSRENGRGRGDAVAGGERLERPEEGGENGLQAGRGRDRGRRRRTGRRSSAGRRRRARARQPGGARVVAGRSSKPGTTATTVAAPTSTKRGGPRKSNRGKIGSRPGSRGGERHARRRRRRGRRRGRRLGAGRQGRAAAGQGRRRRPTATASGEEVSGTVIGSPEGTGGKLAFGAPGLKSAGGGAPTASARRSRSASRRCSRPARRRLGAAPREARDGRRASRRVIPAVAGSTSATASPTSPRRCGCRC